MRTNLDLTHGLIYAEAVSLALSEKLNRASAHKLVESACRSAQFEKRHLRAVLSEDADVNAILKPENIASLFEPANYLVPPEHSSKPFWPLPVNNFLKNRLEKDNHAVRRFASHSHPLLAFW
jgi:hypothetical protein